MPEYTTDLNGYSRRRGDAQRPIRTHRSCPICSGYLILGADDILHCDGTTADGVRCTYRREVSSETY